ncbi:MAG: hypothetical protein ABC606_00975 [Candidatus Methanosuratincola petrocarbonis]
MRLSKGIDLLNALIVVTVIAAFTVTFILAINAFSVVSSLRVGEPSVNSSGSVVEISFPISLSNSGPFAVSDIRVSAELRDFDGSLIASASSQPFSVPAGARGEQHYLPIRVDLSEIPQERLSALFSNARNLKLGATAGAALAPFVSVSAHLSGDIPWSPPVKDFELGDPVLLGYNSTHIVGYMPVRFENSADIAVEGTVNALFVDADTGSEIGSGYLEVDAPPRSEFAGELQFTLRLPENASALMLEERTFRCNATFGFRVFGIHAYSVTSPFELAWGPPVGSPYLGSPSVAPYNSTHSLFRLPFGFTNANELVTLDGSARLGLEIGGSLVAESAPVGVHAPPGYAFSGELTMLVPNWALSTPGTLIITMETQFGIASVEVPVNG